MTLIGKPVAVGIVEKRSAFAFGGDAALGAEVALSWLLRFDIGGKPDTRSPGVLSIILRIRLFPRISVFFEDLLFVVASGIIILRPSASSNTKRQF